MFEDRRRLVNLLTRNAGGASSRIGPAVEQYIVSHYPERALVSQIDSDKNLRMAQGSNKSQSDIFDF
jgi:hypothetical protein